jgi:hypothetical protein
MRHSTMLTIVLATLIGAASCGPPEPYVRYQGHITAVKPGARNPEVFRTGPPPGVRDLGTVIVTCPSEGMANGFGAVESVGGCSYDWAVWKASHRAAEAGADGIHTIEASVNASGKVVSLRASAFIHVATPVPPAGASEQAAPAGDASPSVEERLRRLEKLKTDKLITPEEYATKRAEILKDI